MIINHTPITKNQQLLDACAQLENAELIAFDTEFVHRTTYWAKLCLLQIATEEQAFLVDPLSPELDIAPLLSILLRPDITKVVHAGIQDVEILYLLTKKIPPNLYDTQIMSRFCTTQYSISLANLVQDLLNTRINKEEQLSDWSLRPLSKNQCRYALGDVIYLPQIFHILQEKIHAHQRQELVQNESQRSYQPNVFAEKPQNARQKIKAKRLSPIKEKALNELAIWRENVAIKKNVPRKHIVTDNVLVALAQKLPKTEDSLKKIGPPLPSFLRQQKNIKKVIDIIQEVTAQNIVTSGITPPPEELPSIVNEELLPLLAVLLTHNASKHHIAPQVVISTKKLRQFLENPSMAQELLAPWQWEIFGKQAQQLLNGKAAITVKQQQIKIVNA